MLVNIFRVIGGWSYAGFTPSAFTTGALPFDLNGPRVGESENELDLLVWWRAAPNCAVAGNMDATGGAGADRFGLAANALASTSILTITDFHNSQGDKLDLSALLDAKFGIGSDPSTAPNFIQVKEDATGNSATLYINGGHLDPRRVRGCRASPMRSCRGCGHCRPRSCAAHRPVGGSCLRGNRLPLLDD
jgi:hypothetical protein